MNTMQRAFAALTMVSIATVGLTACSGSSSDPGSGTSSTSGKKLTIAFVVGASSDPFFLAMKLGAQQEAKKLGADITFQGDATTYSPATQIPVVNQVLAAAPDGLAIAPTDPEALQPAVDRAVAAGIPVVNVDTSVKDLKDVTSFITGNNADGGAKAADALASAMGYKSGGTYKTVVGLSSATSTTNVARLEGFKKQIAAKYPGITIAATGYSQSNPATANTNVNNWITAYPDLKGIFAIDGTNADGASSALKAKGLAGKISLVGYDAYASNVDRIGSGVISALIAQDPAKEGSLAVQDLIQAIKDGKGAKIEKTVTLPAIALDKSTSAADLKKYTYVQSAK